MDKLISQLQPVNAFLDKIQNVLDFDGWELHSNFATTRGLGRVALIAVLLGILWGFHAAFLIILSLQRFGLIATGFLDGDRLQMGIQFCFYMCSMSAFHLSEFFTTAIFNPTVANSESYLVNHSKAYTAAFIVSFLEFSIRFCFLPRASVSLFSVGSAMVAFSQGIRAWAMITCGESFNHLIQTSKKDNHVLIKHGIYKYLRHPSYVGFFYWSIATQVVLNNWVSTVLFASASFAFFRRRIPYEEESLIEHFPEEYEAYARTAWVGMPFIPSPVSVKPKNRNQTKYD